MSDSDSSQSSPSMTQETIQNETDDPDLRSTRTLACGVIGRRSIQV